MEYIKENLWRLHAEIAKICQKHKRLPEEITLIAVSKTFPVECVKAAYEFGQRVFGENRPQELRKRFVEIDEKDISWHLIGTLQDNKIKYVAGKTELIHSVDSYEKAVSIDTYCTKHGFLQKILIEVNTSGEPTKMGGNPDHLEHLIEKASQCKNLEIVGLMTMAPLTSQVRVIKKCFSTLRDLRDRYRVLLPSLEHLSMGMSNDYAVALEEGATMLRIGTAIFGRREGTRSFHDN
jgi:pyridoxal phosphate enzyme (YggS family)